MGITSIQTIPSTPAAQPLQAHLLTLLCQIKTKPWPSLSGHCQSIREMEQLIGVLNNALQACLSHFWKVISTTAPCSNCRSHQINIMSRDLFKCTLTTYNGKMVCGYKTEQVVTPSPDKTSVSPHNMTTKSALINASKWDL